MACNCPRRDHQRISNAIASGLSSLSQLNAAAILRSGGTEQTYRNLLLGSLEEILQVGTFTEGQGVHVDVALRCKCCRKLWAYIECKNNFASQRAEIAGNKERARNQLEGRPEGVNGLYVHFGTQLVYTHLHPDVEFHNKFVRPSYKRYRSEAEADVDAIHFQTVMAGAQPITAVTVLEQPDGSRKGVVRCWAFLIRPGEQDAMIPLPPASA